MTIRNILRTIERDQFTAISEVVLGKPGEAGEVQDGAVYAVHQALEESARRFVRSRKLRPESSEGDVYIIFAWRNLIDELLSSLEKSGRADQRTLEVRPILLATLDEVCSDTCSSTRRDELVEAANRELLSIFLSSLSDDEVKDLANIMARDATEAGISVTKGFLNRARLESLAMGSSGAIALVGPVVAGIVYQRLTQGFVTWLLINIFGSQSAKVRIAAALAGPLGWSLSAATLAFTIFAAIKRFQDIQGQVMLTQAIFLIYLFRFLNRPLRQRIA